MESMKADLAVIGGGVIGLAIACELQKRGKSVVVLEQDRAGSGATQAAGGMLGPIAEAQIEEPEIITFGLDSLRMYPDYDRWLTGLTGIETGFRAEGTLVVGINRDHMNELEHLKETLRSKGLTADPLTAAQVLEVEPGLSPRVLGGLKIHEDQRIDPRRLTAALVAAFRQLGGVLIEEADVREIQVAAGAVTGLAVEREDGSGLHVECPQAVVATGARAWPEMDLKIPDPGIRPVKGQLIRVRGEALLSHVVRSPDIYLIPQPMGDLLIGATMDELGYDMVPTAGAAFDLLRFGWQLLPGIYELEFMEMAVGLRPALDDHMPVIGPAGTEGLWMAVGHFRKGILMAPGTACHLADWIMSGKMPQALAPFQADRLLAATEVSG
jgi:glycine oxidase